MDKNKANKKVDIKKDVSVEIEMRKKAEILQTQKLREKLKSDSENNDNSINVKHSITRKDLDAIMDAFIHINGEKGSIVVMNGYHIDCCTVGNDGIIKVELQSTHALGKKGSHHKPTFGQVHLLLEDITPANFETIKSLLRESTENKLIKYFGIDNPAGVGGSDHGNDNNDNDPSSGAQAAKAHNPSDKAKNEAKKARGNDFKAKAAKAKAEEEANEVSQDSDSDENDSNVDNTTITAAPVVTNAEKSKPFSLIDTILGTSNNDAGSAHSVHANAHHHEDVPMAGASGAEVAGDAAHGG
jgi:hypothetical protein